MKTWYIFSVLKCNLFIESENKKRDHAWQKIKIEKKEDYFLETRIEDVKTKLKNLEIFQKKVYKTHKKIYKLFFKKFVNGK